MKFISRMASGYWSSAFSSYLEVDTNFHFSWLWNNASRLLSLLPSVHVPAPAFAYFVATRLYRSLSPLDNLSNRKATMIPRRRKILLERSVETGQRSLLLRTTNGCGAFVNVKTIVSHLDRRADYRTVYRCVPFFQNIDMSLSYNDVSSDLSKISQRIAVKTRERMILLLVQITVFSPSALSTMGKERVFHPLGRDRNSRSPRTYRLYKRVAPQEEMEHERFRRLSATRRRFVTDNEWKPRRAYCAPYNSLHFSSAKATKRVHKGLRNNRAMSIALLFAKP